MTDQQDKMTQHPAEELVPADAPLTVVQLANEINDLTNQIRTMKSDITPEYVSGATRDMVATKRAEFETLASLYASKVLEFTKFNLAPSSRTQMLDLEKEVEGIERQVRQMFDTSIYAIADAQKKKLTTISSDLKELRASVTPDFLHNASALTLEEKRSRMSELQTYFKTQYDETRIDKLENSELAKLISLKEEVESLTPTVDRILQNELTAKLKAQQGSSSPDQIGKSASDSQQASGSGTQNQGNLGRSEAKQAADQVKEIENLRKQLNDLITKGEAEKNTTAETIRSLERKLLQSQPNDYADSVEIFEEEAMAGTAPITEGSPQETSLTGLKIGSINMPTFGGNLEEWEAFRDLFEHLVHKSKRISTTVKFYQLRTHLKGAALDTIRGYQVTGTNYEAAWIDLKKRYNRTDELIEEYIRKFFESRPVEHKPNFVILRKIIDSTNQMLRALPNLGATVNNWDPIVNLIISSKLSEELRSEWTEKRDRDNVKATADYLDFLERKAIELQPKQGDRLSQMLKGDHRCKLPQKKVFQITEKKLDRKVETNPDGVKKRECLVCKGNHHAWDCNMLKKESAKARTSIIKALGLCFKCLLKHRADLCDSDDCEYCGGTHHVMLCYKRENENKLRPIKPKGQPYPRVGPPGGPNPGPSHRPNDWEDWNSPAVKKN